MALLLPSHLPAALRQGSTGFAEEEEELPPDVSAALEAEDCVEPAFSAASGDSCWRGPRCASPEECSAFSAPCSPAPGGRFLSWLKSLRKVPLSQLKHPSACDLRKCDLKVLESCCTALCPC